MRKIVALLLLVAVSLAGCVSTTKYNELKQENEKLKNELVQAQKELKKCKIDSYFNMAILSIPIPKAKPVYFPGL